MMYTTLNKLRALHPCADGWKKLLSNLGKTEADDEPLSFLTILESNGLVDAIWCLRSVPEYASQSRLYALWCVQRVQHLMQTRVEASDEELKAAKATEAAIWAAIWTAEREAQEEEFRRMIEAV